MGIYIPRKPPQILTAAWLNEELTAIETAHNSHSKENFPDNCVPLAAMQNRYGYFVHVVHPETNTASEMSYFPIVCDCTLVKYTACAAACDATSTFEIGYYPVDSLGNAGTIVTLLAATNFASVNNVVSGTLSTTLYAGYLMYVNTVTDGSLALKRSTIALTFKAKHTS